MKKYRVFRVQPRIGARVAPSIHKLCTPAISPQNVLTSAQTYLSFSSSTLPMVSCKGPHSTTLESGETPARDASFEM
jgi:hypothetical protein